jgi:hypothetical protein
MIGQEFSYSVASKVISYSGEEDEYNSVCAERNVNQYVKA